MEMKPWDTPINQGELSVLAVNYGRDDWGLSCEQGSYVHQMPHQSSSHTLTITVFHLLTESIYELRFEHVGAYRVLDEHGLLDMWSHKTDVTGNCFKVRNHAWAEESPVSFMTNTIDGWSYMISTDWDCVEVLTEADPDIVFIEKLTNEG